MFEENEKLRQELVQTKMLLEQQQNSQAGLVKKQSSTIVLSDSDPSESQKLKNEIIVLKHQLSTALNKDNESFEQRRIKDLERQVKELGKTLINDKFPMDCNSSRILMIRNDMKLFLSSSLIK